MSLKLKVLGLGLLAMMAASAFAVVNASATSTGHFTAEPTEHHVIVKGTEAAGSSHQLKFYAIENNAEHKTTEPNNPIECTHASYSGTLSGAAATTTSSVQVTPTYTQCRTASHEAGTHPVSVAPVAGCGNNVFDFTSGGSGTVHVNCTVVIKHPQCEITVPPQTVSGVTYTAITDGGKAALTMNVNVKTIEGLYHGGICIFLGTSNHKFEMVGSATVWGENTAGGRVPIKHT
jgi:hypothetical protein